MNGDAYLIRLTQRLALPLAAFPGGFRTRHSEYLASLQHTDGGFPDREGNPDLYYSAFALRGLSCLGALEKRIAQSAGAYLRGQRKSSEDFVELLSLLYCASLVRDAGVGRLTPGPWVNVPKRIARELERFRKEDGGYAKTPQARSGSTYHTFLVALCYELIGRELPRREEVVNFVMARRREGGGFVEAMPARRGGTNPTAAAVALLVHLGAESADLVAGAADFLAAMQGADGGVRANSRAPAADLLSTFTCLLTLSDLGRQGLLDQPGIRRFAESCEVPTGGFRGGLWDFEADAEYTFYGLGTLGLLTSPAPRDE